MIVVAVVAVIAYAVGVRLAWGPQDRAFATFAAGPILVVICGLLTALVVCLPMTYIATEWRPAGEKPLVSIEDTVTASGDFVLGFGSVSGEPTFLAYAEQPDGSLMLAKYPASSTSIVEQDGPPRALKFERVPTTAPWLTFDDAVEESWTLYVPPGTVRRAFTLGPEVQR